MFNAKSPHNSLCFFFEKKLNVLQNYLYNNEKSNKIKRFINFAKAFIIFVTKKNKNFCLCVDYHNLNVITIKNYYFLFFTRVFENNFSKKYFLNESEFNK